MESEKHILIIDDDQVHADLLKEFLTENGYKTTWAGKALDGLTKAKEIKPHLILLDLFLPDKKGSDLCVYLKNDLETRDIPIILFTAHQIGHSEKMQGFHAGADDYLIRPFKLDELLVRIKAILRRSQVTPRSDVLAQIQAVTQHQKPPEQAPQEQSTSTEPEEDPISADDPDSMSDENDFQIFPEEKNTKSSPAELFRKFWDILNRPKQVFLELSEKKDFALSILLVLGTPIIASLGALAQKTDSFDAWISFLALGIFNHLIIWFGTAGTLHLIFPFHGLSLPLKKAMTLAGLTWAPRILGGILSAFYSILSLTGIVHQASDFSAGLDLIPGLSQISLLQTVGRISFFDLWSTYLILTAVWILCGSKSKKWNAISISIGFLCLFFALLTKY